MNALSTVFVVDDRKDASTAVGCEGSDRLMAEFMVDGLAGDHEQAVVPCGHEDRWRCHDASV